MTREALAAAVAGFTSVAAVALSIEELLNRCFEEAYDADNDLFTREPKAKLVQTEDFDRASDTVNSLIDDGVLSIFCFRVDVNRTMRPPWSAVAAHDGTIHLPLDVHFLLTAWESDAEGELRLISFAMQCLEQHPILTGPRLHPAGLWSPGESVQIVNEDLVTEDVLRTFEALPSNFRLSVAYVARVVRVDAPDVPPAPDVVTAVGAMTPSLVP